MNLIYNNLPVLLTLIAFCLSLSIVITTHNIFKKLIALGIFQSTIIMFYLTLGYVKNSTSPVYPCLENTSCILKFTNPLPQVLMLTAIVVGVATFAVGLSLAIKIKKYFNTIEENEINLDD